MSGNKRKISSGLEISFSELKQLAEDGDAIAQNCWPYDIRMEKESEKISNLLLSGLQNLLNKGIWRHSSI